ncbi:MAG: transcription termination/antitermination protein NusA [Lachnospiraceae bacterium]|nr:transcription termination/antitermination protein NusA [Lachnospiraceae bacterium]
MNNELLEALNILEKEKNISKEALLEAIENSLITACKNHFGKADNIRVNIDPETCEFHVYQEKVVVEAVEDEALEISLANARMRDGRYEPGDIVNIEVKSKEFGRIATQNAKNVILQKIREEERKVLFNQFYGKEKDVVTGIVQRSVGRNISINLGKADAILSENEQVRGETFRPTERIKVYILEVKSTSKGPKILVSRTHPELVKRLFESEVTEVREGIVEIKSISREAGSRTKIAVWSNDPDVDPVGACVGLNGARVNAIVNELRGEKIDIINWNDNPAMLIENALSPAKVISVIADAEEKSAKVVVPDYQLSLAIGKEGQNARLAARLTGFKIDIKSETQARESGDFMDYENDYEDYEEEYEDGYLEGDYEEGYEEEYSREGYGDDYADTREGYQEDYEDSGEAYEEDYEDSGEAYEEDYEDSGDGYEEDYEDSGDGYEEDCEDSGDGYEEEYEDEYQEDSKEYEDGALTDGPKEPDAEEGDDHE